MRRERRSARTRREMSDWYDETVNVAKDIVSMGAYIKHLEHENADLRDYKDKYIKLLNSSIKHGDVMMSNVMKLMLRGDKK